MGEVAHSLKKPDYFYVFFLLFSLFLLFALLHGSFWFIFVVIWLLGLDVGRHFYFLVSFVCLMIFFFGYKTLQSMRISCR